jgi:muconolactone D-isomerase
MEFLVEIQVTVPHGVDVTALTEQERVRGRELVEAGSILRVWRIPGRTANVGIWRAADASELHAAISSLPMFPFIDARITPLATHPLEE